jgi:CubicO group peptidase (beta-lactamase class C family)
MVTLSKIDAVSRTIERLIDHSIQSGLLTHGAAFYGRLKSPYPDFCVQKLPDQRDIFDLASMTKALVTTPLVFRSVKARGLSLGATVETWLGRNRAEIFDSRLRGLTIKSLLKHQSGLPAWRNFWVCHLGLESPETLKNTHLIRQRLIEGLNRASKQLKVDNPPQLYSDVGFLLLGLCLTEIEQKSLSSQFWEMIEKDLMIPVDSLELYVGGVEPENVDRAVPTAFCALRGRILVGEVHDENAASLGGIQGHAGLFGTGNGVGRYLSALFNSSLGNEVLMGNGAEIVLPPGDPPNEGLLGWRQGADPSSMPFAQGNAMGHMGFTGVAFWVCPQAEDYAMLLTNRVSGGRTRPGIAALRRDVFASLAQLRS